MLWKSLLNRAGFSSPFRIGATQEARRRKSHRTAEGVTAALESRLLLDGYNYAAPPSGGGTTTTTTSGTTTTTTTGGTTTTGTTTGGTTTLPAVPAADPAAADRLLAYIQQNPDATASRIFAWAQQDLDTHSFGGTGFVQTITTQYALNPTFTTESPQSAPPAQPGGPGGVLDPPVIPVANPAAFHPEAPPELKNSPLWTPQGSLTAVNYAVLERFVWDGADTYTLRLMDDGTLQGLFTFAQEIASHKTGDTTWRYKYVDAAEHAQAVSDLAAKQAALPGLKANAERLDKQFKEVRNLAVGFQAISVAWGALAFAPIPGLGAPATYLYYHYQTLAIATGGLALAANDAATAAQQLVSDTQADIQALKAKVETGQGLEWHEVDYKTNIINDLRPWTATGQSATSWQPASTAYNSVLLGGLLGATNIGNSVIGQRIVASYSTYDSIPTFYKQYVPE